MSSSALAKKSGYVKVTLLNGRAPGQSYTFDKPTITIGRSAENDISFPGDNKMSRNHVEIQQYGQQLVVRNLSQRNFILIDGEKVQERLIQSAVIIQVGEQNIEIQPISSAITEAPKKSAALPVRPPASSLKSINPQVPPMPTAPAREKSKEQLSRPAQYSNSDSSGRLFLYGIVGIIFLAGAWLLSSDSTQKMAEVEVRSDQDITKSVEESMKAVQEIQNLQRKTGQDSVQYRAAQENYIKGFRDYRQGQYARAMQSFQAALALFPNHDLALKYYNRSKTKLQGQIDDAMRMGRSYYQKNNFKLCQSSFATAMIMIKDANDVKYKEARQFYNECSVRLEGRF
jgi:pSer/pThr/pTyr-binding forkhead associated (FHA) protein